MSEAIDQAGYTSHALRRRQKRCIPAVVIDYLLDFGVREQAGKGTERYRFCKRGWKQLQRYLGPAAKHFDRYRHVYVIVSDGQVITIAYLH